MSSQLGRRYDIIINGGGIVGFTLLNLLLKSPHLSRARVLLIEQAPRVNSYAQPPRLPQDSQHADHELALSVRPKFSNRVSSITPTSRATLSELGVWHNVSKFAKDVKNIKVWNYDYSKKVNFEPATEGLRNDSMFSVLENNRLALSLLENLSTHKQAEESIAWQHSLVHMEDGSEDGLIKVVAQDSASGQEVEAEATLVLGCDGFNSKVRSFTGMNYNELNLGKAAVVGTVKMDTTTTNQHNDVAYQRFSENKDAVAALLPLDENYSSFVISGPNEYADFLTGCDDETFIREFNALLSQPEISANPILQTAHAAADTAIDGLKRMLCDTGLTTVSTASAYMTPDVDISPSLEYVVEGSRASFPLFFGTTSPKMTASMPFGHHIQLALLGDAAHRVHPLAGQGLNLGIQDAAELVRQLERFARCGENIFDPRDLTLLQKVLKEYEIRRQLYIIPMTGGILAMPYLFKFAPAGVVSAFNELNPLKSRLVKIANG